MVGWGSRRRNHGGGRATRQKQQQQQRSNSKASSTVTNTSTPPPMRRLRGLPSDASLALAAAAAAPPTSSSSSISLSSSSPPPPAAPEELSTPHCRNGGNGYIISNEHDSNTAVLSRRGGGGGGNRGVLAPIKKNANLPAPPRRSIGNVAAATMAIKLWKPSASAAAAAAAAATINANEDFGPVSVTDFYPRQKRASGTELDVYLAAARKQQQQHGAKNMTLPVQLASYSTPDTSFASSTDGNVKSPTSLSEIRTGIPSLPAADQHQLPADTTTTTAHWLTSSWVGLSLLETAASSTMSTTTSSRINALALTSPAERLVRLSLQRHINFHLSSHSSSSGMSSFLPRSSTTIHTTSRFSSHDGPASRLPRTTTSTTTTISPPATLTNQAHERARDELKKNHATGAIHVYQELLATQHDRDVGRADTLSRLSMLCMTLGRFKEAMSYSTQAYQLHKQYQRPIPAAVSAMEVGLVWLGDNKLTKSLQAWREAMHLAILALGYDHPYVAILLNNIAVLHFETGDLPAAVRVLEESVELQRKLLGWAPPVMLNLESTLYQLATSMTNLALVGARQNELHRAINLLEEALSLYQSIHDAHTDNVERLVTQHLHQLRMTKTRSSRAGSDMLLLSSSRAGSHDSGDSFDSQRSASLFGHSDGIPSRRAAAKLTLEVADNHDFILLGPLSQERTAEQRVRELMLTWFGRRIDDDHNVQGTPFLAFEALSLHESASARLKERIPVDVDGQQVVDAELHLKQIYAQAMEHLDHHEIADALDIFQSALRSHKEKYGLIHHLVGTCLHNIGMVHLWAKDYPSARVAFKEAADVRAAALGADHPDVALSMMKIGLVQLATGDLTSARRTFLDIRDRYLNVLGYGHPQLAKIMNNIAVVQYSLGELGAAHRSFEKAYEYQRRLLEDGPSALVELATANTLSNVGFVYARQNNALDALQTYEVALQILQHHPDEPMLRIVQDNINYLVRHGGHSGGRHHTVTDENDAPADHGDPCLGPAATMWDLFLCGGSEQPLDPAAG